MFRFASPHMLYLLLLVPLLAGLFVLSVKLAMRRLEKFGDPGTVRELMPDFSPRRIRNKFIIWLCAVVLLIFALARPQTGAKYKEQTRSGIELVFVVDVSNSMLAQDFEPNRLERTKASINRLLGDLQQDRVGLVVFAGDAYVQLPITSDYLTARNFISHLSTNMVSKQGTAMGAAIELASNIFSSSSEGSRAMIIISDGENHEDDAVGAARAAHQKGITIYTIGIGTPEGAPIIIGNDFIRDTEGNMVVSKLDEAMLEEIALLSGGAYIRATNQSMGLTEIIERINSTDKTQIVASVFEEYNEHYRYLLFAALAILLIESLILSRKNRLLAKFNIFEKRS